MVVDLTTEEEVDWMARGRRNADSSPPSSTTTGDENTESDDDETEHE